MRCRNITAWYQRRRNKMRISSWICLTFHLPAVLTLQLILGSWLNMFGALLRFFGTLVGDGFTVQFSVVMLGQTLGAVAQPLIIFTPTKLAALWFPDHQRATANTIASMCE